MKVNKAATGDTASLLFQSAWTGHAEMGLAGSMDFSIKVSDDGVAWTDAMVFDALTGHVTGAAVQASVGDFAPGKLAQATFTYGPGNLLGTVSEAAGQPTGAVIEQGSNAQGDYVRFADGTQICTAQVVVDVDQATGALYWSGAQQHAFPMAFSATPVGSGALASLASGWVNGRAGSAITWDFAAFATASTTGETADLIAIGRWY
ncbi:hypothetical protein [Cognatishimia maritima]|uniref:hypothetical protein n=1 Tax=Cognatishimia maritima TaxID=870908 RepID=UPI000A9BBC57|nr:hypothetical protein [Cognatishimia maritima]